jgi:murein L,D-transpeptidase YcbB/YkuD
VKQNKNSANMSKLLYAYTNNLANSCIDLNSFNASQKRKKAQKINTHYSVYLQTVDRNVLMNQLRSGNSIEKILKPYVPKYHEFPELVSRYNLLKAQGKISKETLRKIRLNIERIKLLKPDIGDTYVFVNIPEFRVRVFKDGEVGLMFGTVIGKPRTQTPIFSSNLKYIIVNPTWNIPDSIARSTTIPKMLRDPSYLSRNRIVIRKGYDLSSPKVSRTSVNWKPYVGGKGHVPYKFIKKSSDANDLGRVKFIFPNEHSVYMHDTPSKYLFKRKVRTYSHGCIRLEKPLDMLSYLIRNYSNESMDSVMKKYHSRKSYTISLNKQLPVHTAY